MKSDAASGKPQGKLVITRAFNAPPTVETRMVGKVFYAAQMLAGMEAGWNQSLDRWPIL